MSEFKFSLGSDNHSGVHPKIMQALESVNTSHAPAYGTDEVTIRAKRIFEKNFGPQSETLFVFNGTAANILCLRTLIQPHEAVIASSMSHLHMDECGAPEYQLGSKLYLLDTKDGKIKPDQIPALMSRRGDQHYAQPRCLSLTQPTEVGTVYSMEELRALAEVCKQFQLKLHIDGARLILAAAKLKKSFKEFTFDLGVDAISFGGTKNGLLFGEACIFKEKSPALPYLRKQSMQLPSKMRFLSSMFLAFFENDLWLDIANGELDMAQYLKEQLQTLKQAKIAYPVEANSVFLCFPKKWTEALRSQTFFYIWDEYQWMARLMCSFDTRKKDLDLFVSLIKNLDHDKL